MTRVVWMNIVSQQNSESNRRTLPNILVIDDTPANLMAMTVLLRGVEANVLTADSGNSGLAMALEENVALILLDVNMPDMDGFEVAELLKNIKETRSIPIIFLTAFHQDEASRLKGYDSGAIDYIEKPIHPSVLLSKTDLFLTIWRSNFDKEQEIDRRVCVEKEMEYLAQHDSLTHLMNRRQLNFELDKIIARSSRSQQRFAVVFLDLDGFKKINDQYGHEAGDVFLKAISLRFKNEIRSFDIVSRYGGDEFIIVLTDISDALALANKVQRLIKVASIEVEWNETALSSGASVGVSFYPEHGESAEALINKSDSAMYLAKEVGKNTFRYYSEQMNNDLLRLVLLETKLKQAYQENKIQVFYQPIVDIKSGKPVAAEALVRWFDEELGFVNPEEFIKIAENNGFIDELGLWVLSAALEESKRHPELTMSVNASPLQFNNDKLSEFISRFSKNNGLFSNLCIEITEGLLLEETSEIKKRLFSLRDVGVELSIDDFGTGYSSLSYLKRCPVSKLKIDRAFVSGIPEDDDSNVLVRAIITMSHALGLQVIAEGVETIEQWKFLQKEGCDFAQGYYFSKAVNSEQFSVYMESYK